MEEYLQKRLCSLNRSVEKESFAGDGLIAYKLFMAQLVEQ